MKIFFGAFITLFFILPVHACNSSVKSEQKILADNVNFNLDYEIIDEKAIFKVTVTGLNEQLYLVDNNNIRYYGKDKDSFVIDNLVGGTKYKFTIYSDAYNFCDFGSLTSKTITTPVYNRYYKDDLCLKHKDSNLCNRWGSIEIKYEDLKKELEKSETNTTIEPTVSTNNNYSGYLGIFITLIIIISSFIIVFIKRKNVGF